MGGGGGGCGILLLFWSKRRIKNNLTHKSEIFFIFFFHSVTKIKINLKTVPAPRMSLFVFVCVYQGKDLWLQGMISVDTVYVEYRADVHVFDHLVLERFHYQVPYAAFFFFFLSEINSGVLCIPFYNMRPVCCVLLFAYL